MNEKKQVLRRIVAGSLTAAMLTTLAAAADFKDIKSHWAKSYIEDLAGKGKISGYEDGSFKPDAQVTNLETLIFVSRLCIDDSLPQDKILEKWSTVIKAAMKNTNEWAYKNLAVCLESGILTQAELEALCQSNTMGKPATREDLAVYLVRAMGLAPVAATLKVYPLSFADVSTISADAKPAVYLLSQSKIVEGMENNKFQPQGQVTRGQVAAMLSRAMEYMSKNSLVAQLPEYTNYAFEAGTVASFTVDGSNVVLSLRNAKEETVEVKVPNTVPFVQDGAKVDASAITTGAYARVCYKSATDKTVERVTLLTSPKVLSGSLLTVDQNKVSLKDAAGASSTLYFDRFTQVLAGGKVGDRTIIDAGSGYQTVSCITDGTGKVLSIKLMGGTYAETGIIAEIADGKLLVNNTSGILTRYDIPTGAQITLSGTAGALTTKQVGRFATVRISYDTGKVTKVEVDNTTDYVQAIFDSVTVYEGSSTMKVAAISTGNTANYKMQSGTKIYYEGKEINSINLGKGSMVTLKLNNNQIVDVQAASGNYTTQGSLAGITFGTTIIMEIKDEDGNMMLFNLTPSRLPSILRDGKSSSIDKLTSADTITVMVKSGKVSSIEAKTKSTTVSGKVERISLDSKGNLLYLIDKEGTATPYTLSTGVSVVSGSTKIDITDVVNGNVTLTIVNGLVTEVKLTGGSAATGELVGNVLFVNVSDKVILLETESARVDNRVSVSVPSTARIMTVTGGTVTLSGIELGDQLQVYGSYKGDEFIATMVIVK